MNLLNGASVCPGFRFRDDPEDFLCQITRTPAHIAPVDDGADIGKIPVCVMMMFRLMMMLMQVHIEIAAFDAAGFPARYRIIKALKAQAVQYRIKLFPAAAEVEQGCNGHVAGNPGCAFEIQ